MFRIFTAMTAILLMTGCASTYVTPGGHVDLSNVQDAEIKDIYATKPTAKFPAYIAFTRIQQSGYSSHSNQGYGSGVFSVITNREIESDEDIDR